MGQIQEPKPVLPILAAFSQSLEALTWAKQTASEAWGPIVLESEPFEFVETDYYEPSMGPGLKKQFFAFENLLDPGELPAIKRQTNEWEAVYAKMEEDRARQGGQTPDGTATSNQEDDKGQQIERPLNLDPGYITEAKLVLASTKDHAHRIYLSEGIYAEVTLHYQGREWRHRDWTFPDYRREDYQVFFTTCRNELRRQGREGQRSRESRRSREGGSA
ncbi:unnamed protein product [marine sediment metagenome]|uniref:GTP-binding protein n=1 Tax=marine sediment metagenome TaxID=412755 RepID=X0X5U1_9ZZZZ